MVREFEPNRDRLSAGGCGHRQPDHESGALIRDALEGEAPAMFPDDFMTEVKTEAGSLTNLLGGEKRLKNIFLN